MYHGISPSKARQATAGDRLTQTASLPVLSRMSQKCHGFDGFDDKCRRRHVVRT
jgi:hypothetical protein